MSAKKEPPQGDATPPASGSKKKLIIISAAALVLLAAIGGGVWYFFLRAAPAGADGHGDAKGAAHKEEAAHADEHAHVSYLALEPMFIANLQGKPSMLQVGLRLRIKVTGLEDLLKHHDPMVRHTVLSLLAAQDGQSLKNRDAKEKLRADIKAELNKLIKKVDGKGEIDEVFFSSFAMQ